MDQQAERPGAERIDGNVDVSQRSGVPAAEISCTGTVVGATAKRSEQTGARSMTDVHVRHVTDPSERGHSPDQVDIFADLHALVESTPPPAALPIDHNTR